MLAEVTVFGTLHNEAGCQSLHKLFYYVGIYVQLWRHRSLLMTRNSSQSKPEINCVIFTRKLGIDQKYT